MLRMDQYEVTGRTTEALRRLIVDQWELAALDLGERTITSHLFSHLVMAFQDTEYDVDHEYNRRFDLTKELTFVRGDELGEHRIFPDLIVHGRNRDSKNLVAIEIKKGPLYDSNDRRKVLALLTRYEYQYRFGVLLALSSVSSPTISENDHGDYYEAWTPRWEWMTHDEGGEVVTVLDEAVFDDADLTSLNREGWLGFCDRSNS